MGSQVFATAMALGLIATACSDPPPKLSNGKTEAEAIAEAQVAVERQLKDPRSAQWGATAVHDRGYDVVVCGLVNSKNGFGGYTGETVYFYKGGRAIVMEGEAAKTYLPEVTIACG